MEEAKLITVKEDKTLEIMNLTQNNLLEILCKCGEKLIVDGKGWLMDFRGDVEFTCPCGEKVIVGPSMFDEQQLTSKE